MTHPTLYLASASPRRRELLTMAGFEPVVCPADADEGALPYPAGDPAGYVTALARLKNDAAYPVIHADPAKSGVLLSADTIVVLDPALPPLGKPHDIDDARRMLQALSGHTHHVLTGVVLRDLTDERHITAFASSTAVTFRTLADDEIETYIASPEPYDKAGGYGIQGAACAFVEGIVGDYANVVGLPVCRVVQALRDWA